MLGSEDDISPEVGALLDGALALHYQPVADCGGGAVGLEALMRWHHDRGSVSPEAFIPIFEQSGLIVPVSRWALHQACADAASWRRPLQVAVNLSAMQLADSGLPVLVERALARSGLPAGRLELELTEGALVHDAPAAVRAMRRLREIGVGIALADFGTGQSGPSYLRAFPFTSVKISRRLVAQLERSTPARSIVRMIIALGHSLGLSVAADDVETDGQLGFLDREGCDRVQGFLIGRPGPVSLHAALTGAVERVVAPAAQAPGAPAPIAVTAV